MTRKDWDDVMNINIKTVIFFSQTVAKQYIKQGTGGKIVNIASMHSFQGGVRVPSYTASKSGVMGITSAIANEWVKHNISVNAIAPMNEKLNLLYLPINFAVIYKFYMV